MSRGLYPFGVAILLGLVAVLMPVFGPLVSHLSQPRPIENMTTSGLSPHREKSGTEASMETEWMARGLCREIAPSTFFPSDGVGVEVARRICADCPVRQPCLEYALANRIDRSVGRMLGA